MTRTGILFALAVILILCAAVFAYFGTNSFLIRSAGLLLLAIGLYLVKISRVDPTRRLRKDKGLNSTTAMRRPTRRMWITGVAMFVVLGVSSFYLYKDALDGYHEVWPLYLFVGVGLVCTVFWSYLYTAFLWGR